MQARALAITGGKVEGSSTNQQRPAWRTRSVPVLAYSAQVSRHYVERPGERATERRRPTPCSRPATINMLGRGILCIADYTQGTRFELSGLKTVAQPASEVRNRWHGQVSRFSTVQVRPTLRSGRGAMVCDDSDLVYTQSSSNCGHWIRPAIYFSNTYCRCAPCMRPV